MQTGSPCATATGAMQRNSRSSASYDAVITESAASAIAWLHISQIGTSASTSAPSGPIGSRFCRVMTTLIAHL